MKVNVKRASLTRTVVFTVEGATPVRRQISPRGIRPDTLVVDVTDGKVSRISITGPCVTGGVTEPDRRLTEKWGPWNLDQAPTWARAIAKSLEAK
ncbi:MAG TPA: hypothetical protein VFU47_14310 [Armatimonadota bacterium]|nr:hypothetical protein [Armatimonadota bacterium]